VINTFLVVVAAAALVVLSLLTHRWSHRAL